MENIQYVMMTPDGARGILMKNTKNRALIRQRVRMLTEAIARGEWVFDGNPIKIGETGVVRDGQHRLAAIAAGETTVPTLLVTGLSEEAQLVMDSGKPRSFSDYLTIKGVPNSHNIAAATKHAWTYEAGLFGPWKDDWFQRPTPTNTQLWERYARSPDLIHEGTLRAGSVTRHTRMSNAVLAGSWVTLSAVECDQCGAGADDAGEFYDMLAMKAVPAPVVHLLQKKMAAIHTPGKRAVGTLLTQANQTALLFKTWNAWREGRDIVQLRYRTGGSKPEVFPVPH